MCEISKERNNNRSPLLPDRHDRDFFVCDIFDAAPKGDVAGMEYPIFSLSTKPDTNTRSYRRGDDFIDIHPGSVGLATIHDRDILIYCISQLIAALNNPNRTKEISKTLRFKGHDLLIATNRMTNGQAYESLKAAMERLSGTRISTNITTGGQEKFETFGLIEHARVVRETRDGRMQEVEVTLSDWVFNAIRSKEVLTLSRDYFRLRKPLERRIYEFARKHCGNQSKWSINLTTLREKCGSTSTIPEFKRMVSAVVKDDIESNHIPDYAVRLETGVQGQDIVVVYNRNSEAVAPVFRNSDDVEILPPEMTIEQTHGAGIYLEASTYEQARAIAKGWDIYHLEGKWREWITDPPRSPDAAFLGFCRKWVEKRGNP